MACVLCSSKLPGKLLWPYKSIWRLKRYKIEDFARQFSSNVQKEMPTYLTVGNSTFAGPEDVSGYTSITEQFSISALGQEVPHIRFYKQKQFGNNVVNVICQVSNEDEDFVAVGFDQIMSSLQYDGDR